MVYCLHQILPLLDLGGPATYVFGVFLSILVSSELLICAHLRTLTVTWIDGLFGNMHMSYIYIYHGNLADICYNSKLLCEK
jgi:hypothetical protein